jgi:hypothetical protein
MTAPDFGTVIPEPEIAYQTVPEYWTDEDGEQFFVTCEGITQDEAALSVLHDMGEGAFEFDVRKVTDVWDCEACCFWDEERDLALDGPQCSDHPKRLMARQVECYVFGYFMEAEDGPDDERSDYYIAGHTAKEPKPWQVAHEGPEPEPIPVVPGQIAADL